MKKRIRNLCLMFAVSVFAFSAGIAMMAPNKEYAKAAENDAFVFAGASVKLAEDSTGLRFRAKLNADKYNEVISTEGENPAYKTEGTYFGMLITPVSYITSETTDYVTALAGKKVINLTIPAEKVYEDGGAYYFNGVATNLKFNSLNIDLIGIGYYYNGSSYEYASFNAATDARNVALVAGKTLTDASAEVGGQETILQNYITNYLYRNDGGIVAYESQNSTIYYKDVESYKADESRTGGYADIEAAANAAKYTLEYLTIESSKQVLLSEGTVDLSVTSKIDGVDFSNLIEWKSSNTSVATIDKGKLTLVSGGETVITAKLFGAQQQTKVSVITKQIATEADLRSLITTEDVSGYYVLTNDITLTQEFAGITTGTFTGVFDGQGHSISGSKITYGLLGKTAKDTTVKNLAIVNCTVAGGAKGAIVTAFTGNCTIENIYVNLNTPSANSNLTGNIAYSVTGTLNAKNVVAYLASNYGTQATFVTWTVNKETQIIGENCYAGSGSGDSPLVRTATGTCTGVENYTSLAAMQTAYANEQIDISWAKDFSFYNAMKVFFGDTSIDKTYISSEAELRALITDKDVVAHIVLTNDIVLTQEFAGITTGTFTGVFDGQGHTITADSLTNGLLGKTAKDTTVRNLHLSGKIISGNGKGGLVNAFSGNCTVENVYVNLKKPNSYASETAPIAHNIGGMLTVKNVVSYFVEDWIGGASFICWNKGTITGTNCCSGSGAKNLNTIATQSGTCTGVENYTSLSAMQTAYENEQIDISWAKDFSFYSALTSFLTAE